MKLAIPDREFGGYIFDCDGTLADTMPLHFRAWTRIPELVLSQRLAQSLPRAGDMPGSAVQVSATLVPARTRASSSRSR